MKKHEERLRDKNVLITGGLGFIGSNLARRLVGNGADVTLLVSPKETKKNIVDIEKQIEIVERKIGPYTHLDDILKDKDYMFHFAWQTDLEKSMKNPMSDLKYDLGGLINILESCKKQKSKIKIIFPSTVTVAGDIQKIPANEKERTNPLSIYDANKLAAENYLTVYFKNYGVNFSCLRLPNVFGEWQRIDNPKRGIVNFIIGRVLREEEIKIYGDGNWIRDYSHIQNFVDAFILAAESEKTNGEIYVIGSGKGRTFNEIVSIISKEAKKLYGIDVKVKYVPFPKGTHEINKRDFVADPSKFRGDTGWKPKISFEEGIRRTIEFYKKNG